MDTHQHTLQADRCETLPGSAEVVVMEADTAPLGPGGRFWHRVCLRIDGEERWFDLASDVDGGS